jgi:hypothetical protein
MSIIQGVESLRAHHFGGPAKSTLLSTVTPPTELSRFRARSGPAAACSFRRKTSGRRGDLNDWLRVEGKGRSLSVQVHSGAGACGEPTPWALQIQRLTPDLAPWDLEDYADLRELLCELAIKDRSAAMRTCERSGAGGARHTSRRVRELAQSAGGASVGSRSRLA